MGQRADEVGRPLRPEGEIAHSYDVTAHPTAAERDPDQVDTELLQNDIEQTRAEMGETIDAIQERISPEHLKEQAMDRVREATVGRAQHMMSDVSDSARETGSSIVTTVRRNPLPSAMIGAGLVWLWKNRQDSGSGNLRGYGDDRTRSQRGYLTSQGEYAYSSPRDSDRFRYPSTMQSHSTATGWDSSQEQGRVSSAVDSAQERAGELAGQANEQLHMLSHQAGDQLHSLGNQAGDQVDHLRQSYQRLMRENPLVIGGVALGLGLAVGLAVPETQKEHQLMGEARDSLVDKAQSQAQETMGKVQQVAQDAVETTKHEAEQQGLTTQSPSSP